MSTPAKTTLHLSCTCGELRAIVRDASPATVNHAVCYCKSCAAYLHELGRGDMLDERGGTHAFSPSPRDFEITHGLEHLALLRMTPKGALRWYAGCCNTPLTNTLPNPKLPFLAIPVAIIDTGELEGPVEDYVGPVRARVNGAFSGGEKSEQRAGVGALLSMVGHIAPLFFKWKLRGDHKHMPFFDERGRPIREARLVPRR